MSLQSCVSFSSPFTGRLGSPSCGTIPSALWGLVASHSTAQHRHLLAEAERHSLWLKGVATALEAPSGWKTFYASSFLGISHSLCEACS